MFLILFINENKYAELRQGNTTRGTIHNMLQYLRDEYDRIRQGMPIGEAEADTEEAESPSDSGAEGSESETTEYETESESDEIRIEPDSAEESPTSELSLNESGSYINNNILDVDEANTDASSTARNSNIVLHNHDNNINSSDDDNSDSGNDWVTSSSSSYHSVQSDVSR